MFSLIYFLAVLSVLVLVHEIGHFMTAKRIGVRVEKFSFGFGPKVWSVKMGDTEYMLSLIPLGGYVKMAGDDPTEKLSNQKWEFLSRSVFDRFKIIFAGPLLNYILAFVVFSVIFMFGSPTATTEVGSILKGYPAEAKGMLVGDKIIAIDGKEVRYWEDMTELIHKHQEGPMNILVRRGQADIDIEIMPVVRTVKDIFGKETKIALVGISPSQKIEKVKYGPIKAVYMGARKLLNLTAITYKALWSMLTGRLSFKESMTGPIGIFVITGETARMGLIYVFHLLGLLSASLAIFNMLPFPILDGGHIMFLAVEKLRGKPLSIRTQEIVANVAVSLLILLAIFIFYSDIIKFGIVEKTIHLFKRN